MCMYMYMNIYTYDGIIWLFVVQDLGICIYKYMYNQLTWLFESVYIHMNLYIYICVCTVCRHICKYAHTSIHIHTQIHMWVRAIFYTLQYTATQCNTLQHTATHCSTLQHTAAHCSTLQHTATHCNTLQHSATHCNTLCICVLYSKIFKSISCVEILRRLWCESVFFFVLTFCPMRVKQSWYSLVCVFVLVF